MTTPSTQQTLQTLSEEYQKLQTDLQTHVSTLSTLSSQRTENSSVLATLSTHPDSAAIYKLIGPVLLKQEKAEAETAVRGRLDFIGKETERVEKTVAEMQERSEGKKMEVYQLQTKMQEGK
ncbi:MAG: hypothetical protein LQ348_002722 [Seirophora lacunosa]|nr:MAG: hypothetical protein LQ344_006276 [Seirophora lacunosa]KAI4193999.1 MAG: hypothetical protein LQ348_002722 [Seirophora lacunosa]